MWENLKVLVEKVLATEDKPAKLAIAIKAWCRDFGITLNREELAEYRVNMLPQPGEPVPQRHPGERPAVVYNQVLIADTTNQAISVKQSNPLSN